MKKISFETVIDAPAKTVWEVLWKDETYRKWTAEFSEGSYAESDWSLGSTVKFLSPGGGGLYSEIVEMVPAKQMSFKHLGVLKDFEPQPSTEETKAWEGATENYYLSEEGGYTRLKVVLDITESHQKYFEEVFPKALQRVKELAEFHN